MEHSLFAPGITKIGHNAGFFSCCSVRLGSIVHHFNTYKFLPKFVDSSFQFRLYKEFNTDVTFQYFKYYNDVDEVIEYSSDIDYHDTKQFTFYKNLDFEKINPFVRKYFSPSKTVEDRINRMIQKYNIDFENTCGLFHRGHDKCTEHKICTHEEKLEQAKLLLEKHPNIKFLIQSDETEFINKALETFPNNSFYCKEEIFHMPHNPTGLIDYTFKENPEDRAQNFLAVIHLLARCKHLIASAGNCDIWILLFRGHANNLIQYFDGKWKE